MMLDPASIFYHAARRGVSPRGSRPRVAVVPMERVRAPQVSTVTPAPPPRDATPLDPPAETMGWLRANTGAERTRKIAVVIASAALAAGVDPADVRGRSRLQGPARARHVAVWLLSEAGWTLPQIGQAFGRDHTTALNSARRVDAALAGRTFGDEARIVDVARDVLAAMDGRIAVAFPCKITAGE